MSKEVPVFGAGLKIWPSKGNAIKIHYKARCGAQHVMCRYVSISSVQIVLLSIMNVNNKINTVFLLWYTVWYHVYYYFVIVVI